MSDAVASLARTDGDAPDDAHSDSALWQRYRQGDATAFAELHARYRLPLFRFLHRILLGVGGADDVYQEVWLQIIERAATFRLDGSFRIWLFTLARSRALDRRRRDGTRTRWQVDVGSNPTTDASAYLMDADGAIGTSSDDPVAAQLQVERGRLLAAALAEVPEAQREVFLLREEAELSLPEVARVLGVPYEAAKSRYRYALARLRAHFGIDRESRHEA